MVILQTLSTASIAVGNTAVQLSTSQIAVPSLTITASSANVDTIYIGDSTVTAANGIPIAPGASATITAPLRNYGSSEEFLLSDLYINSPTAGSAVRIAAWRRK